jgi:hypothetical protein
VPLLGNDQGLASDDVHERAPVARDSRGRGGATSGPWLMAMALAVLAASMSLGNDSRRSGVTQTVVNLQKWAIALISPTRAT